MKSVVRLSAGYIPLVACWFWLLGWSLLQYQADCILVFALMFPIITLISLSTLEASLMRKRAFALMFLADKSWLSRWWRRKFIPMLGSVLKALLLTFILLLEASDWSVLIWSLLLVDTLLVGIVFQVLNQLLRQQVKPAQTAIVSRKIIITGNTILLALVIASVQFFTPQQDYRQHSWQETVTHSASTIDSQCQVFAPLLRLKSVKDAVGWRLAATSLSGLSSKAVALLGWCIFLFSSSLSLWAFSRLLGGSLMRRTELLSH